MEFTVSTDLSVIQSQKIESNIAEVKAWLENALAPYRGMVVSEDAIASAKTDRANINKLKKALDDKRKSVKTQWVAPYTRWEAEVMELTKMCDEAASNIDTQVKNFENQLKEQKRAELESYFTSMADVASVSEYITFDGMFNPKWLNATMKLEAAKEEIRDLIDTTVEDVKTILDMESEYETSLLLEYKKTHDIRRVLSREKELTEAKLAAERMKALEAQKASKGAEIPTSKKNPASELSANQNQAKTAPAQSQKKEKLYTLQFEVELTRSQMFELKDFFESRGIKFHKIEEESK